MSRRCGNDGLANDKNIAARAAFALLDALPFLVSLTTFTLIFHDIVIAAALSVLPTIVLGLGLRWILVRIDCGRR